MENEYWKDNKVGYYVVMLMILGYKFSQEENKELEK